jgi:hypothetical protein
MTGWYVDELTSDEFLRGVDLERPLRDCSRSIVDSSETRKPIAVWKMEEPPPLSFVWEGLIPAGFPTSLYGDGAVGKSYLALGLAAHITLGLPYFGRGVTRGQVLYIDAELDDVEFRRRAFRVARGLNFDAPPDGLYYLRLSDAIARGRSANACVDAIASVKPVLTILDSLTVASPNVDPSSAAEVTVLMKELCRWGTCLIIDHIPKQRPGESSAHVRAFGSAFKYNLVRSSICAARTEGGGLTLRHVKSNFGNLIQPIYASTVFESNTVRFEQIAATDSRLVGVENHLTATEQLLRVIASAGTEGADVARLAQECAKSEKTVRNYLTILRRDAKSVERVGGGKWRILNSDPSEDKGNHS